jgi:hypothetical protein
MMDLTRAKGTWEQLKVKLPDILSTYQADVDVAESRLALRGKTGAEALKEQTGYSAYYGMRKAEINKLLKYLDGQVSACRSRLYVGYNKSDRALGDREREKYINNEPEYLSYHELYLEVEELRDKFSAICDAWTARGFSIRDWTQLKIASQHDDPI